MPSKTDGKESTTRFRAYFVETDFVFRFSRPINGPATNPFTFNMVFGVAF